MEELDFSPLCHKFAYKPQTVVEGQGGGGGSSNACSVKDTQNLGRCEASLEAVPPLVKTSNHGEYCL